MYELHLILSYFNFSQVFSSMTLLDVPAMSLMINDIAQMTIPQANIQSICTPEVIFHLFNRLLNIFSFVQFWEMVKYICVTSGLGQDILSLFPNDLYFHICNTVYSSYCFLHVVFLEI